MWKIKQKYEIDYPERLTVLQRYSTRMILRSIENGDFLEALPLQDNCDDEYSFIDSSVKYNIIKRYSQSKNIYCNFDYKNMYQEELDNGDIVFRQITNKHRQNCENGQNMQKIPQKPLKIAVFEGICIKAPNFIIRPVQFSDDVVLKNINIVNNGSQDNIVLSANCSDIKIADFCNNIVIGYKCCNISIDILCKDIKICNNCRNVTIGHCCNNIVIEDYAGQGGSVTIKHNSSNLSVSGQVEKNIKI